MQLDTIYATPGFLLLAATADDERLGCIGLRDLGPRDIGLLSGIPTGEIRRLFVRPQARGTGLGRNLVERLMADAADLGLRRLVLNTLPSMTEAIALYRSLGFEPSDPYTDEPLEDTLYFGLDLPR